MIKKNFTNGSIIEPQFLNQIQSPQRFNSELARANFFSSITSQNNWEINQRDALKDWELPHPALEPQTTLGRLAHHGRILGWYQPSSGEPLQVLYGPPRVTTLEFNGITPLEGFHVIVEAGMYLDANYEVKSWERSLVPINPNQISYVYYDIDLEQLTAQPILPQGLKICPLAKLEISNSGNVINYTDLRLPTYISNFATYTKKLTNSLYIAEDFELIPWQRAMVDTSVNSIILTVPEEAQDGDEIAIMDITFSFDINPIVIRSSDTKMVHNTTEDWVVYTKGGYLELYYHHETRSWNFKTQPPKPPKVSNKGDHLRCGGMEYIGIKTPQQCPHGQIAGSDGKFWYNVNTSQCYKEIYQYFSVYSDGHSGVYTEPTIRCGATKQQVLNWLTT